MNPLLRLELIRLDVERWERSTGMNVRGVLHVPSCEFLDLDDWTAGVALSEQLAEATEAAALTS